MDKDKRKLTIGLVKKEPDPDQALHERNARRLRRRLVTIIGVVAILVIVVTMVLQYYVGLSK